MSTASTEAEAPRRSCVLSEPCPHPTAEAKPVQGMFTLKEAALFALGTGMQEQPAHSALDGAVWGGGVGEGIWTASGEVVSFWFEPGMQCSSNSPESAQSGSRAASRFPRLSRVTQSSIQTKI